MCRSAWAWAETYIARAITAILGAHFPHAKHGAGAPDRRQQMAVELNAFASRYKSRRFSMKKCTKVLVQKF
jgi:hypothetical protein